MDKTISIRLPEEVSEMLEDNLKYMQSTNQSKITYSDVIRNAIAYQWKGFKSNIENEKKFRQVYLCKSQSFTDMPK